MAYTLQWGQVTPYAGYLLGGAAVSLGLALLGFVGGFAIGLVNAAAIRTLPRSAGRREELDAAAVLGLSQLQTLTDVVLPQVCRSVYPALSNQYILVTMTTSIASIFGIEELTGRAYNVNAETFRSLEIFSLAALDYVGLTIVASLVLALAGRWLFGLRLRLVS